MHIKATCMLEFLEARIIYQICVSEVAVICELPIMVWGGKHRFYKRTAVAFSHSSPRILTQGDIILLSHSQIVFLFILDVYAPFWKFQILICGLFIMGQGFQYPPFKGYAFKNQQIIGLNKKIYSVNWLFSLLIFQQYIVVMFFHNPTPPKFSHHSS